MKLTDGRAKELTDRLKAMGEQMDGLGWRKLQRLLGISRPEAEALAGHISMTEAMGGAEEALLNNIRRVIRRRRKVSVTDISIALDRSERTIIDGLEALKEKGYNLVVRPGQKVELPGEVAPGNAIEIVHDLGDYQREWLRIGATGDWHMGNMHARLDVLHNAYDLFEAEGITTAYCTGNWIDGEARFNKHELLIHGMDNQLDYWIENTPQKKGITTYFIAGDDHEGWYQQRESIEIGKYAMLRAREAGRNDLVYIGYMEADVELRAPDGSRWMKVIHPGGGAAYAVSYTGQKLAESLQGGEKPAVVLQGHFHKFNVGYPREIFVVDTGTCCDQTGFMRKKRIQAHVGYSIVEFMQAEDGRLVRFRTEFLPFYDRGYYTKKLRTFK